MAAPNEEHGNVGGKTLFVRNLPYSTTNESLEKVFSEVGPTKQCFVVSDTESGKCRGFGYVKYTLLEDAQKSVNTIKKVDGRAVQIMFANRKEKKKRFGQSKPPPKHLENESDEEEEDMKPDITEIKEEPDVSIKTKNAAAKKARVEKVKKESKAHNEGKRARLIVRNLSFKCSETQLKNTFSKYGTISDVHIPTKNGGRKLGFGFIQFSNKAEAGMAVKELNGKAILDRKVAVDFTLPKEKFEQKIADKSKAQPKISIPDNEDEEEMDVDEMEEVKEEEEDIKEEEESEDSDDEEEKDSSDNEEEGASESEHDKENDEESDDSDEGDDNDEFEKPSTAVKKFERPQDVNQGKTVFIRNIAFDTEEEDIEEYFSQFGGIKYTRSVIDHATGMSKGSAFVQFMSKESADLCLKGSAQSGQHLLGGRELLVTLAVDRNTAQGLKKDKTNLPKDSRNLYLAREGMIRPGTEAAKDVPAVDLSKRLKNDALKRRKLKDQNTFVSSTRLCVHNIPATVTDKSLREIVVKSMGDIKKSELSEVRIMRDLGRVNSEGMAKSRGYGFVAFATHEAALASLQQLNNNPSIFGPHKRPIVEFSIENRKALKTKEKRVEKSKMRLNHEKEKEAMQGKKKPRSKKKASPTDRKEQDKVARSLHSGPLGLPRHSGAKQRHKPRPSQTQVKKPKGFVHPAKAKQPRRQREAKFKQETSRRQKGRNDIDSFDKLVASHKKKIMSSGGNF